MDIDEKLQIFQQHMRLSLYEIAPEQKIELDELVGIILGRMKLLHIINLMISEKFTSQEDKRTFLIGKLDSAKLQDYLVLLKVPEENVSEVRLRQACDADHLAHHMLSLAFRKTHELRAAFIELEWEWLACKFGIIDNIEQLLRVNKFKLLKVEGEEKSKVIDNVASSTFNWEESISDSVIFKVSFTDVPDLIKSRSCYLEKGYAYVVERDMIYFFKNYFYKNMEKKLIRMSGVEIEDYRINRLISVLNLKYIVKARTNSSNVGMDEVEETDLDAYSKVHYPLCMKALHDQLRNNHHLRHYARLQYGLFLKGIGVSCDTAQDLFKREFMNGMSEEEYKKGRYSYMIEHQYGRVGSMVQGKPYDCEYIINSPLSAADYHGCPFAHWDKGNLTRKLAEGGVSSVNIEVILNLLSTKKYGEACAKYFEFTRGKKQFNSTSHPNEYFVESVKLGNPNFHLPDIEDIFLDE